MDGSGNVTLLAPGTVRITATLKSGAKGSYKLTIVNGEHPRMESIEMTPEEMVLEVGEYAKLQVTVQPGTAGIAYMGFFSEDTEVAKVDYKTGLVTGLKPGTTTISMNASGDYESDPFVVEKYCKITVVEKSPPVVPTASIETAEVTGLETKTWTGSALTQSPVVKLSGKTLECGTDYTVSYKNNKNVGEATLTITGKGEYTGTITKTFRIRPKGTSIAGLKKARKAVRVKWKKQPKKMSGSRITGYHIQLATNSEFTNNKKSVMVRGYSKVSRKVKGLKAKEKYYVRVRTYKIVRGVKYYSSWSKVRTVKTR